MNTRTFATTASYYRAMTEAEGMAGECFFATGEATYTWEAGSAASIESPAPPYPMGQTSVQSPTACVATSGSGPRQISQLCPLVLDLSGDGIATTSLHVEPVRFWDQNGDGTADNSGWLAADDDDAFLWLDLTADGHVQPQELFGSAMVQSDGSLFRNGFQALEVFDLASAGGNGDGVIDDADAVWPHLLLWRDRNHDAMSQSNEIAGLATAAVLTLGLARVHDHSVDPAGNAMMLVGNFTMSVATPKRIEKEKDVKAKEIAARLLADVSFAY